MIATALAAISRLVSGANVEWRGTLPSGRQRIYFANHSSHLDFPIDWSNCRPFPDPQRGVVCHFEQKLEPGEYLLQVTLSMHIHKYY